MLTHEARMGALLASASADDEKVYTFIIGPSQTKINVHASIMRSMLQVPLLNDSMAEAASKTVTLPDDDAVSFEVFVKFMYKLEVSENDMWQHCYGLLRLSNKYCIEMLHYMCEWYLCWRVQVRAMRRAPGITALTRLPPAEHPVAGRHGTHAQSVCREQCFCAEAGLLRNHLQLWPALHRGPIVRQHARQHRDRDAKILRDAPCPAHACPTSAPAARPRSSASRPTQTAQPCGSAACVQTAPELSRVLSRACRTRPCTETAPARCRMLRQWQFDVTDLSGLTRRY